MKPRFQLKNTVLLMALASAYPVQALAAAGVAQFTAGDVTVRRGTTADALTKGKDVESGDAIVTGPNGRAQVRFSDGGLISLQPNSQFKIDNYADRNDPKEDRFLVNLLQGGMRAITGLIGKRDRANYKVMTQTATIGIRGSGFNLSYNPDGTLSVTTEIDEIEVCTRAGCVGLTAGESALVTDPGRIPSRTSTRASIPTPEPRRDVVVSGDQVSPTGTSAAVPTALTGIALSSAGVKSGTTLLQPANVPSVSGQLDQRRYLDGSILLNPDGTAEQYLAAANAAEGTRTGTATLVHSSGSYANGDLLMLGTWSAGTWVNDPNGLEPVTSAVAPSAFVAGVPTSSESLASLVGKHAEYSLAYATPVFSSTGPSGTLQNTSKLSVDFGSGANTAVVNLDMLFGESTAYKLNGTVSGTGSGFAGNVALSGSGCEEAYCSPTGSVSGFFSGSQAAGAGLTYGSASSGQGVFGGAATFSQTELTTPAPTPTTITQDMQARFADSGPNSGANYFNGNNSSFATGESNSLVFSGEQLTSANGSNISFSPTGTRTSFGSVGHVNDSDFIGWGSWVAARAVTTGEEASTTALTNVHYITGRPTAAMPASGTASYGLVGGSAPTASGTCGCGSLVGTLVEGQLNVDFGLGTVGVYIKTSFHNGNDIAIISPAAGNVTISGGTFSSNGNGNATVNGIFAGTDAYRAGLVYSKNVGGSLGTVAGSAAFQRIGGINP